MPTVDITADTTDGHIDSSNATYATARSGSGLTVFTGPILGVGQLLSGGTYTCIEYFVSFDTSSLGAGATITSAVLSIQGGGGTPDQSDTDFTVEARAFNFGASVTTGDWVAGASLGSSTLVCHFDTSAGWGSGYNAFTNDALPANINKTGTTYIMLSSSRHRGNNTPVGLEKVSLKTSQTAGTSSDPKLTITYTAPLDMGTATFASAFAITADLNFNDLSAAVATSFAMSGSLSVSDQPTVVDFTRYDGYFNTLPVRYYLDRPPVTETNDLNPPKQDIDTDPIEIRPESGFLFGQKSFAHGMGQDYFHIEGRDTKKYFTSEGIDISQADRITNLNQTASALASATIGAPFVVADTLLTIDGNVVKRSDGNFPPSWSSETLAAATVYDATVAGAQAYAGVNSTTAPLYARASGGTTWSVYQSGGVNITLGSGACTNLAWIKDRLMAIAGTASRSIYEVTGSTATPTAIRTLPAGWVFSKPFEGGSYIYCLAQEASNPRMSKLYIFGLNSGGTAIEEKGSMDFPKDTVINAGCGYLDTILMAGGVRNGSGGYDPIYLQGFPNDSGMVQWVIIREEKGSTTTDLSSTVIVPNKRSVLVGWSLKAASFGLNAREGLAVHHLATGAFAHHVRKQSTAATPAKINGIAVHKNRVLFSVAGDGLYYENLSTPVAQGELITSVADWGNAGFKVWDLIDLAHDSLPASCSVTIDYATEHPADVSTWSSAMNSNTAGSLGKTTRLSNIKERKLVLRIRSNASGSNAPEIRSYTVRSNPAPDESEWKLSRYVQLYDEERKGGYGEPFFQNPDAIRDALMDLAYSWIHLTEEGITWTALVQKVSLLEPEQGVTSATRGQPRRNAYVLQMQMLGVRD